MKYWEIIADNLKKAGWSWGYVSAVDSEALCHVSLETVARMGLLGDGLVVCQGCRFEWHFGSHKTAIAAHFFKPWLYVILRTLQNIRAVACKLNAPVARRPR